MWQKQHPWRQNKPGIASILTVTKPEATTQLISTVSQFHPDAILTSAPPLSLSPHIRLNVTWMQRRNHTALSKDLDKSNWRQFMISKARVGRFKCHFILFSAGGFQNTLPVLLQLLYQLLYQIPEMNTIHILNVASILSKIKAYLLLLLLFQGNET